MGQGLRGGGQASDLVGLVGTATALGVMDPDAIPASPQCPVAVDKSLDLSGPPFSQLKWGSCSHPPHWVGVLPRHWAGCSDTSPTPSPLPCRCLLVPAVRRSLRLPCTQTITPWEAGTVSFRAPPRLHPEDQISYLSVHSLSMCSLRACCVPGAVLRPWALLGTHTGLCPPGCSLGRRAGLIRPALMPSLLEGLLHTELPLLTVPPGLTGTPLPLVLLLTHS